MLGRVREGFRLARKDLEYHRTSTLLIVLVIALICLPLVIVSALREGYVAILKRSIESSTQATRIDIAVDTRRAQALYITPEQIETLKKNPHILEVVPHKFRTVFLHDNNQNEIDFEMTTTIPGDPDLVRWGFSGDFTGEWSDPAVIISKTDLQKRLGRDKPPESLEIIVRRTINGRLEAYALDCPVIGTLEDGPPNRLYVPLAMGNKLERWTLGYGITDYGLPPGPNREEALGEPDAEEALVYSDRELTRGLEAKLRSINTTVIAWDAISDKWYAGIIRQDRGDLKISEGNLENIAAALSDLENKLVIPRVPPLDAQVNNLLLEIHPSATADPRSRDWLTEGTWPNHHRALNEIVLPENLRAGLLPREKETPAVPFNVALNLGDIEFTFKVTGWCRDPHAFAHYRLLFRIQQVLAGDAVYDQAYQTFDTTAENPYQDRFLFGRVFARSIKDITAAAEYLEKLGYDIFASSRTDVTQMENTNQILRNLMFVVMGFGLLAVIASTFVLMLEAIKRKRNEIGIMLAMGISRGFLTLVFLFEALIYGLAGCAVSLLLFWILAGVTLDSELGHRLLAIDGLEGNIFSLSPQLSFFLFLLVCGVSMFAGMLASHQVRKTDPADILS